MAELTHFYNEENAAGSINTGSTWTNTVVTGENPAQILGTVLSPNTKYLIVARCLFGSTSTGNKARVRVQTDDDTDIESKSEMVIEFQQTATNAKISYFFIHSFTTGADPEADVEIQMFRDGSTITMDQSSLFLLDLDNIGESGHWDGTVTDNDAAWSQDANIADGNRATNAFTSTAGSTSSNEIRIANNQHPTSGDVLEPVTVQFSATTGADDTVVGFEVFDGGDSLVSGTFPLTTSGIAVQWTQPFHIPAPSGGWTATKMEGLEVVIWKVSGSSSINIGRVDFRTGYVEHSPTDYSRMTGTDTGAGDLSETEATTQLARLDGAALSTDEYLILGYAAILVDNLGKWHATSLHAAYDTSTAAERSRHQAEGEDTGEQRLSGYAIRHQASSGTPNVTLYGVDQAGGGANNSDGGAYLIALPTSLFADFVDDYEAGAVVIDGTETTIATTGSYTPTTTGNHLIIGRSNGTDTPTALGGMWVESTTTEIRTGDSTPTHNQGWDTAKDDEQQVTFQRYSITTAETFNLRSQGAGAAFDQIHRWLIVVNLNPPAVAGAVYPPFPRRQNTLVRM